VLTLLAAALRFGTLDARSFWMDEVFTVALLAMDLREMLRGVPMSESTPPLYYLVGWGWARIFGLGEIGARSLPAALGVATVPLAYLAARELVSVRAGVVTAALVAVNPMLIWYSQEARSYALLVFASTVALLFFARALADPAARTLDAWAIASMAAIASHYFAAFLFLPQAAWLLRVSRARREVAVAAGSAAAVGAALVPLALHQRAAGLIDWIDDFELLVRLGRVPVTVLAGVEAPAATWLAAAAAVPVMVGVARWRCGPVHSSAVARASRPRSR